MEVLKINDVHIDVPLLNVYVKMEVILDEVKKNGICIDVPSLNIYMNHILDTYKSMYDEATNRLESDQLIDVFHENCFNTVGRVMAYLTLVRCMKFWSHSYREETVRKVVRLVAASLWNITRVDGVLSLRDAPVPDEDFIHTLCSSVGYTPMDTT